MSLWKKIFGSGSPAEPKAAPKPVSSPTPNSPAAQSKSGPSPKREATAAATAPKQASADERALALFDTYKKLSVSDEDNKKGVAILTEILGVLDLNTTKLHPGVVFYQRAMRYKFLHDFDAALKDLDQALAFAERRGDRMLDGNCQKQIDEIRQSKSRAEIESSGGEKAAKLRAMESQREAVRYSRGPDADAAFASLFEDLSNPDPDVRLNASRILADSNTTLGRLVSIYKECLHSEPRRANLAGRVLGRNVARGRNELISSQSANMLYGLDISVLPCSCVHCGFMNLGIAAPARGIEVPYYHQADDKAAYAISLICDKCSREFFVVWYTDPTGNTKDWECPTCRQKAANSSDAFFRSIPEWVSCRCGDKITIEAKGIDRSLGLIVGHRDCPLAPRGGITYLYIPPDVWCPRCRQNLVQNWKSLVVYDHPDEAEYTVALRARETPAPALPRGVFHPPPDSQLIEGALAFSLCDKCGKVRWLTPDGRTPHGSDLDYDAPLRCYYCGRWAVFKFRPRSKR